MKVSMKPSMAPTKGPRPEAIERRINWLKGAFSNGSYNAMDVRECLDDMGLPGNKAIEKLVKIIQKPAAIVANAIASVDLGYQPWAIIKANSDSNAQVPSLVSMAIAEAIGMELEHLNAGLGKYITGDKGIRPDTVLEDVEKFKELVQVHGVGNVLIRQNNGDTKITLTEYMASVQKRADTLNASVAYVYP